MKAWILSVVVLIPGLAFSQHFKVLHSFGNYPNDGAHPVSDVAFDNAGNLYGTTPGGGNGYGCGEDGCGSVFELSPKGDGTWKETIIYSFCANTGGPICTDGAFPDAGLTLDAVGNLYGATSEGGQNCPTAGCGLVFELSPPSAGKTWTETVLHNFCSEVAASVQCLDGEAPWGQLVFDSAGNLYGTTTSGGSGHPTDGIGGGTVFELSPGASGWTETVLYNFCTLGQGNSCPDGIGPFAGVTFDTLGNLYGTTVGGGSSNNAGDGTVYELSPNSGGWKETVLLALRSKAQGFGNPRGAVTFDAAGNLYSTYEGPYPHGAVFRLNRETRTKSVFTFNGKDGDSPAAGVYVDPNSANVYGTTGEGGNGLYGNIFRLTQSGKETVLHTFCSWPACDDGVDQSPCSSLITPVICMAQLSLVAFTAAG